MKKLLSEIPDEPTLRQKARRRIASSNSFLHRKLHEKETRKALKGGAPTRPQPRNETI